MEGNLHLILKIRFFVHCWLLRKEYAHILKIPKLYRNCRTLPLRVGSIMLTCEAKRAQKKNADHQVVTIEFQ